MTVGGIKRAPLQCCQLIPARTITIVIGVLTISGAMFGLFSVPNVLSPLSVRSTFTAHNIGLILLAFSLVVGAKNKKPFLLLPFMTYLAILIAGAVLIVALSIYGQFNIEWVIQVSHVQMDSSEDLVYSIRVDLFSTTVIFSSITVILMWFFGNIRSCYSELRRDNRFEKKVTMTDKF